MLTLLLGLNLAFAHSGPTDSTGCHTNRKTDQYHCHGKGRNTRIAIITGTAVSTIVGTVGIALVSNNASGDNLLGTGRTAGKRTEVMVMSTYGLIWTAMIARPLIRSWRI